MDPTHRTRTLDEQIRSLTGFPGRDEEVVDPFSELRTKRTRGQFHERGRWKGRKGSLTLLRPSLMNETVNMPFSMQIRMLKRTRRVEVASVRDTRANEGANHSVGRTAQQDLLQRSRTRSRAARKREERRGSARRVEERETRSIRADALPRSNPCTPRAKRSELGALQLSGLCRERCLPKRQEWSVRTRRGRESEREEKEEEEPTGLTRLHISPRPNRQARNMHRCFRLEIQERRLRTREHHRR